MNSSTNWNWKSKRAVFAATITVAWIVSLFTVPDVGKHITPYVLGLIGIYIGAESYRPSGVVEGILREDE